MGPEAEMKSMYIGSIILTSIEFASRIKKVHICGRIL